MAKKLLQTDIKREKGKLYFCKGDPIEVYEAEMAHGRKKKK